LSPANSAAKASRTSRSAVERRVESLAASPFAGAVSAAQALKPQTSAKAKKKPQIFHISHLPTLIWSGPWKTAAAGHHRSSPDALQIISRLVSCPSEAKAQSASVGARAAIENPGTPARKRAG
jgi:hypothetical protein